MRLVSRPWISLDSDSADFNGTHASERRLIGMLERWILIRRFEWHSCQGALTNDIPRNVRSSETSRIQGSDKSEVRQGSDQQL